MARAVLNVGMPIDSPIVLRDGVMHREADAHGNGKWYALEKEHPVRRAKGDLGNRVIPGLEPRYSFERIHTPATSPTLAVGFAPYELSARPTSRREMPKDYYGGQMPSYVLEGRKR